MMYDCWTYQGFINPNGYAYPSWQGKRVYAHRAVYEALVGPIPPGWPIDHLCKNRACYNPLHLEAVTTGENVRRNTPRKPRERCKWGHELTLENTYFAPPNATHPRGQRRCRTCRQAESTSRRS